MRTSKNYKYPSYKKVKTQWPAMSEVMREHMMDIMQPLKKSCKKISNPI